MQRRSLGSPTTLDGIRRDAGRRARDHFGYTLALEGTTAVIGAMRDTVSSTSFEGSAYVFEREGNIWTERQKLAAGETSAAELGVAVALHGDTTVLGAPSRPCAAPFTFYACCAAYVVVRQGETWSEQPILTPEIEERSGHFGQAVALFGDTALIGTWQADRAPRARGALGTSMPMTRPEASGASASFARENSIIDADRTRIDEHERL